MQELIFQSVLQFFAKMLVRLMSSIRNRWHPLWRLRQSAVYRRFQDQFDFTVYKRLPDTNLKVALRCFRDATWIVAPSLLEPSVLKAFGLTVDHLRPKIFWDVGANLGFYSWFMRQCPSVEKVVVFEPDPMNFALIQQTIHKNKISDCEALNIALSDVDGTSTFLVDRAGGAAGSLESASHLDNPESIQYAYNLRETIACRTATIDSLISAGIPAPDLIKIDVEGSEHLVLGGAALLLARQRPAMIVETSNTDLIRHVRDAGYAIFQLDRENVLFVPRSCNLNVKPFEAAFPECERA
jgi:FkbM family methyltransferase